MAGNPDRTPARDPERGCEPVRSLACDRGSVGHAPVRHNGDPRLAPLALDVRGTAEILSVSPRHLEALNAQGLLPRPIRLGRRRLWPVEELRRWLDAGAPPREEWEARREGGQP